MRYVFADEGVIPLVNAAKADPQKIGEALQAIKDANKGRLQPKSVVEAARPLKHPLHRFFEWNDVKAAEAFRLDQARTIIRAVRVEDEAGEKLPAFVSVSDGLGTSYKTNEEVLGSFDLQTTVLARAMRDLAGWQARYRMLAQICPEVEQAREKLQQRLASEQAKTGDRRASA